MELKIPRTTENINFNIQILNMLNVPFEVQHGTYTTTIITEEKKVKYMMNKYNNRVFACAKIIKRDVLKSSKAQEIMADKFFKINYGFSNLVESYQAKRVLNIDISSAYASCLYNNKLITEATYQRISTLPKVERLPVVGMLATSYTKFIYDKGECIDVKVHRAETANVFFYLIDEINYIMQEIRHLLGNHFIFYWVDGVFFSEETPKSTIKEVEHFLLELGYRYKYEAVRDFSIDSTKKSLIIKMNKNNEFKQYSINHDNVGESVKNYLLKGIKQQETTPNVTKI
jgi:hypothetical protein